MKYKILKGTELFNKLVAIEKKCKDAVDAADAFAKTIGAVGVYSRRSRQVGGVGAFRFPYDAPPDKKFWMQPDRHNTSDAYYPRSGKAKKIRQNDELHDKISKLPVVEYKEINEVIGFKDQWVGFTNYITYGLEVNDDYALIEVGDECAYEPLPGMIEITISEYNKLKNQNK